MKVNGLPVQVLTEKQPLIDRKSLGSPVMNNEKMQKSCFYGWSSYIMKNTPVLKFAFDFFAGTRGA